MKIGSLVLALASASMVVCLDSPGGDRPSGIERSVPNLDGTTLASSQYGTWGNNLDLSQMERLNPSAYLVIMARISAEESGSRPTGTS